jgi:hypothetical protein
VTTATTQSPDLRFTRLYDDVPAGGSVYAVWERILPRTWARVPGVRVYNTGTRRVLRWRATLTRGSYATRHAAACAALAQDSASRHHVDAAIADPQ